jgi:hypothetical protein
MWRRRPQDRTYRSQPSAGGRTVIPAHAGVAAGNLRACVCWREPTTAVQFPQAVTADLLTRLLVDNSAQSDLANWPRIHVEVLRGAVKSQSRSASPRALARFRIWKAFLISGQRAQLKWPWNTRPWCLSACSCADRSPQKRPLVSPAWAYVASTEVALPLRSQRTAIICGRWYRSRACCAAATLRSA